MAAERRLVADCAWLGWAIDGGQVAGLVDSSPSPVSPLLNTPLPIDSAYTCCPALSMRRLPSPAQCRLVRCSDGTGYLALFAVAGGAVRF